MRAIILFYLLLEALEFTAGHTCPTLCNCLFVGPQAERFKVKCNKDIHDIKDVNIDSASVELYHLDLSRNSIYVIERGIFKNLTNLRRLDLSVNKITALDEGSFSGLNALERLELSKNQITVIDILTFRHLSNLKRLDLSFNKLYNVEPTLFHNLLALERLKLNGNILKTLAEGTFYGLKLLRQIDLSSNPWNCDCLLYWLSNWKNNSSFKLNPVPTCESPESLHQRPITDLKLIEDFHCEWTSPVIEIHPSQNQVVFAGDSISLKCSAPSITDDRSAKLSWLWNRRVFPDENDSAPLLLQPENTLSNIKIVNRYLSDSGIIDSSLNIFPVKAEHNGHWNCLLVSMYGNKSKAISIIVISEDTRYCPLAITQNNKGTYAWPRTVVGWKVELPCEGTGLASLPPAPLKASYHCNATGYWNNLNTEACPFVSSITKILEQYSKLNFSLTKGNLLEAAKRFKNYTLDPVKITDSIEIHFIVRTIENYLNFLVNERDLGGMLIEIINSLMNLSKIMFKSAEISYNAGSRLIKALETITERSTTIQVHNNNLAIEKFLIKRDSFVGLTCTWYSSLLLEHAATKLVHCTTNNRTAILNIKDRVIEASIQLPGSILNNLNNSAIVQQLMISMYSEGTFFPVTDANSTMKINAGIVGSKLLGLPSIKLIDPVFIVLRTTTYYPLGPPLTPVVWDSSINETGSWTSDGCDITSLNQNLVVFRCHRLGYYGLLEDTSYFEKKFSPRGEKFRYSNPAIYIGTFIAVICLTCTSITYIICYASIAMPKRAKHSVINTWIAIILLCILYTAGIQQTENLKICQGVGLALHYLSLCCLLWMVVSASNMYKRLAKSDVTAVPDDEIPEQPIPKPLLGLYLVGWGIALIVCGISGAINLRQYASQSFCFLTSGPALTAVFVPSLVLIVYLTIVYLLVRCTIRSVDVNGQLSEGTQATENMDLELLEPHEGRAVDQNSVHSTQTVSSEVEDVEHSQITQLKGHVVILIFYLIMWLSGAAATTQPFSPHLPYEETIFACLYALSSTCLGLFVLLFYGIARSDVRSQWTLMRCWLRRRKNRCCRTRSVCDANPSIPAQPLVSQTHPSIVSNSQGNQMMSDSNSVSSSRHTSASRACNTLKIADLSVGDTLPSPGKVPNVNLVVLHRQQYRSNNSVTTYTEATPSACVEMFYNPHQSGVARKFFKKQRRHIKNNNLGPRKQGDGGVTSDGGSCISLPRPAPKIREEIDNLETSMFGSGAKVNNTNIHVELNPVNDTKNVNILSDSGGSLSEDQNIPLRYVIGQENLVRNVKKVNNNPLRSEARRKDQYSVATATSANESDLETRTDEEKHLRNVSQQCSLEYSSELESATQLNSERSDHDLPEICETPETLEKIVESEFAASNVNVISEEMEEEPHRLSEPPEDSHSLLSLTNPENYQIPGHRNSFRSSFNDLTSLTPSSKICEVDSRASMDDLQSEESEERNSRLCRTSQRSLTDENSVTSDMTYSREIPLFTGSLSNINRVSVASGDNDSDFGLLEELTLPNLGQQTDMIHSLTDLSTIGVALGATRHLDMNASIGVDYEDTNFSNSEHYPDDVALDDEVLLDSGSLKKETSV